MLRIAVVEDDKTYAAQLKEYLVRYGTEKNQKISVALFPDGEDIVTDYSAEFDIILMDVEMTFMDGMPQYAIQGYKVDALDYVLKPISYFAFSQRIDRALTRVKKKEATYITVAQKGGKKKLNVDKICYVEVRDHDLIYHSTKGDIVTKSSMKEAEDMLDGTKLFRCNRCYLVNLEYVEDFRGNDVTVASDVIQVSRARKKAFMDALNDYMNEVGR